MFVKKSDKLEVIHGKNNSIIKFFIIALFSIIFVLSNISRVYAEEIKIKVDAGFEGKYKIGHSVPLDITIENNLKDISGKVQVEIINKQDDEDKLMIYSKEISLPKDTEKVVKMNVPINRQVGLIRVNIVENDKKLFSDNVKISVGSSDDKQFIGILSDDYDSVNYFNSVEYGNNKQFISAVSVALNEKNFPSEIDVMKNFNVIVINNFNTSNLSSEQYDTLKNWVYNGGNLIIGTGPSHRKTLSIFKDDFISGNIGELSDVRAVNIRSFGEDASTEPMVLNVLDIKLKSGVSVLKEEGKDIILKSQKGGGNVAVVCFDLGLEPINSWNVKDRFSRNLLKNIDPINDYNRHYDGNELYYNLNGIFRYLPEVPVPNGKLLMIIFFIYILIAGPMSYIILKKKDKRELMWITVPVLAVLFSAGVYFVGFGTRITKPLSNVINFATIDKEGNIGFEGYGSVFLPSKKDVKLECGEDIIIKPVELNENNTHSGNPVLKNEKLDVVVNVYKDKTTLDYYDVPVFTSKYFELYNRKNLKGAFECDVTYDAGRITGTISNNSPFEFEEGYIINGGMYIPVGKMQKGESKNIDASVEMFNGEVYDFINSIYRNNNYGRGPFNNYKPDEVKVIKEARQNERIIDVFYEERGNVFNKPVLIGFSKSEITHELLINGKETDKTEKTFIVQNIDVNLKKGDKVELPYGYIKAEVIENTFMDYDMRSREFYGAGNAVIQYEIGAGISVEEIGLKFKDPKLYNTKVEDNSKMPVSLWNKTEEKWDETNASPYIIKGADLEKYLSNNILKIKVELKQDDTPYELPQISVKGSGK